MAKKRPCGICRRWFEPHPRAGDRQTVCCALRARVSARGIAGRPREQQCPLLGTGGSAPGRAADGGTPITLSTISRLALVGGRVLKTLARLAT
jgi:hypothetical protein